MSNSITKSLQSMGAAADSIVRLDGAPAIRHLPYLDLVRLPEAERPAAVVEFQRQPVAYVADGSRLPAVARLLRTVSLRDEGAYVIILEPGKVTVHDVAFGQRPDEKPYLRVNSDDAAASSLLPSLALAPAPNRSKAVHDFLFGLLTKSIETLRRLGVGSDDALSLVGRALFFRFLIDRGFLREALEPGDIVRGARTFEACFDSQEGAAATSRWLDATFNGDMLPLSERGTSRWFGKLKDEAISQLSRIARGADASGQLRLPTDWEDIDFAHVPIGLLSQVYENHCHRAEADTAGAMSIHYTPRAIAEYMLDQAFEGLEEPWAARVLDPAAGAGVFLIGAFRRLVGERWRKDGRRPGRKVIRSILADQLAGFDTHESALRLAGLGLYLTALELDPSPQPVTELKFENLRGKVLFDVSGNKSLSRHVLGSLAPVNPAHRHRYDLVIGNPPWTAIRRSAGGDELRREWVNATRDVIVARLGEERVAGFAFPDCDPDLPFFYRAMEWARPGGTIAFACHARLLFRQRDGGVEARRDLLESMNVTGILNGAGMRRTRVWPNIEAPYCLVFGDNSRPGTNASLYYASPEEEPLVNGHGRFRVDASAARPVTTAQALKEPTLFKTLFRGTQLDASVMRKLNTRTISLQSYLAALGRGLAKGYQVGGLAAEQHDASALHGLPNLDHTPDGFRVDVRALSPFRKKTLSRPRARENCDPPLLLLKAVPPDNRAHARALLALEAVAYNESFIGLSLRGVDQGREIASYLQLLVHSNVFVFTALMTSSQFGVERSAYLVEDVLRFPIVPWDRLNAEQQHATKALSRTLLSEKFSGWDELDAWATQIYGLDAHDHEVIADTLSVSLPHGHVRDNGLRTPTDAEVAVFIERVRTELSVLLGPMKRAVTIRPVPRPAREPWLFFQLDVHLRSAGPADLSVPPLAEFMRIADEEGASQVVVTSGARGTLQLGVLAQYRYWTPSRARPLAIDLLYEHEARLLDGKRAAS